MDFFQIGHKSNTKVLFNLKGKPVYNIQKQYLDDLPVFEECSYLINCVVEKSRLLNFDIEDINFGFYFDAPDVELELISIKSEKHMFYISIGKNSISVNTDNMELSIHHDRSGSMSLSNTTNVGKFWKASKIKARANEEEDTYKSYDFHLSSVNLYGRDDRSKTFIGKTTGEHWGTGASMLTP